MNGGCRSAKRLARTRIYLEGFAIRKCRQWCDYEGDPTAETRRQARCAPRIGPGATHEALLTTTVVPPSPGHVERVCSVACRRAGPDRGVGCSG